MTINCGLLLLQTLTVISTADGTDPPTVTLNHGGSVEGLKQTVIIDGSQFALDVFLGIQYGQSPTEKKRFAPPEKMTWAGKKYATTLPPTCWQYVYESESFEQNKPLARMWINNTVMSEDCLYLNVWAPSDRQPEEKLPVMVWIYGGGYVSGTSTLDVYNASILAAKHKVVVMSMQYRVGAFGFLRLKKDSNSIDEQSALGNMGLLDQTMALEWMQENIELFGGDKTKVTVFGESSGAVSSSLLWLSQKANKNFHRLIIESGSAFTRWAVDTAEDAEKRGAEFAGLCGCPDPTLNRATSLACLETKEPLELVSALYEMTAKQGENRRKILSNLFSSRMDELLEWTNYTNLYFDVPLKAVIDGSFIPRHPIETLTEQHASELPNAREVLLGVNKNEGMYFLLYGLIFNDKPYLLEDGRIVLPEAVRKAAERVPLTPSGKIADFELITASQILSEHHLINGVYQKPAKFYELPDVNGQTPLTAEELMQRLDNLTGELDFICPVSQFAEKVSLLENSKVFLYELQHRTENSGILDWMGVMHGYEIEYVFGMPYSSTFTSEFYTFTEKEKYLSKEIMERWTNFAKTGNPNEENSVSVQWPQYKPAEQSDDYLILDENIRTAKGFHKNGCTFWTQTMPGKQQK